MFDDRYKDKESGKPLFTSCRPLAKRRVLYPLAFLPKEMASHKTFLTEDQEWRSNFFQCILMTIRLNASSPLRYNTVVHSRSE